MTGWRTLTRTTRILLAVLFGAVGCQTLIGVEERHLGNDPACIEYCNLVAEVCHNDQAVYATPDQCLAVCRLLDKGDLAHPLSSSGTNTVACRIGQAQGAAREPAAVCPLAGPGGGGDNACGTDCESYCRILVHACSTQNQGLTEQDCARQCAGLRNSNVFSIADPFQMGDSLECRLNQAVAATVEPKEHCVHASIAPLKPSEPCTDPQDGIPSCDDYCQIVMVACTSDQAIYESLDQCKRACGELPKGTNADSGGVTDKTTPANTIGCRKYHAYSALSQPSIHCPHAGPTGDGYCGTKTDSICESYCMIAKAACRPLYTMTFQDDDSKCQVECSTLGGATEEAAEDDHLRYSIGVANKGGPTVPCRTLHAVRAFADPGAECPAALGQAPCN